MTECEIKSEEQIQNEGKCQQCEMEEARWLVGVGDVQFPNPTVFYRLCNWCLQYAREIYRHEMRWKDKNAKFEEADLRYGLKVGK